MGYKKVTINISTEFANAIINGNKIEPYMLDKLRDALREKAKKEFPYLVESRKQLEKAWEIYNSNAVREFIGVQLQELKPTILELNKEKREAISLIERHQSVLVKKVESMVNTKLTEAGITKWRYTGRSMREVSDKQYPEYAYNPVPNNPDVYDSMARLNAEEKQDDHNFKEI